MYEFFSLILFGLAVWFIASFFWTRLTFIALWMLVWGGFVVVAPLFFGARAIIDAWPSPIVIVYVLTYGGLLFVLGTLYWIALSACLNWLKRNSLKRPWNSK